MFCVLSLFVWCCFKWIMFQSLFLFSSFALNRYFWADNFKINSSKWSFWLKKLDWHTQTETQRTLKNNRYRAALWWWTFAHWSHTALNRFFVFVASWWFFFRFFLCVSLSLWYESMNYFSSDFFLCLPFWYTHLSISLSFANFNVIKCKLASQCPPIRFQVVVL